MKFVKYLLIPFFVCISLVLIYGCDNDDDDNDALVRVIHSSSDAPAVDVYIDDELVFANLEYGESSGYGKVSGGDRTVKVVPAGDTAPVVIEATLPLSDASYTILAVNQLPQIEPIYTRDKRSANSNKAKVRFIHASPDAPAVDIRAGSGDGPAIFSNVAFKDIEAYIEVDGGDYSLVVTPAGENTEVFKYSPVTLENGNVYTIVASGTFDASDDNDFMVRAYVDNNDGAAYVDLSDANDNSSQLYQQRLEIGRALLEVQSTNVAEVLPYYAGDIEYHDPIVDIYGIQDMTGFLYQLLGASPDLVTIVEDETLTDDIYSATWIMSGGFLGVPYEAKGISIFKFRPDTALVYYQRDYYSEGDIMATIPGLDEAIGGFRAFYRCAVDPTFVCPFDGPLSGNATGVESEVPDNPQVLLAGDNSLRSQEQLNLDQLEIARQLVEINAGNWTAVLPFLASEYEYHDPIVDIYGPETMATFLGRLFAGSSDLYTTVEDETLVDGVYMATWTMSGEFNGAPFSAPGMSIVKFVDDTLQSYYSRDYYTEGDVMTGVPELVDAVLGFRTYYRCAVDPTFVCPQ